jgi:hypothetical protein
MFHSSFRGADYDTDNSLVDVKVEKSLSVSKRAGNKFHMKRFDLKRLNDV